ncbi:MAG: HNH endonuclease [Actinomycetota bacterium]|nr:HNH endonuclease [Actinomycetota bacterium]
MERIVEVVEVVERLTQALGDFDPAEVSGSEAVELVEVLARGEKVCAAARARAAARAEDCGAYRARGHHSGAQWLAKTLGTSPREAATSIETARAVASLAATREAFAAGRISEAQAVEVAKAAAVDPSAEAELIATAEQADWRSLKDQVRRVRLNAEVDREALHERQHRSREFHHWIDDDMVAGRFRLPSEVGVPLVNRIDAQTDREYKRVWRQGGRESRAAYGADALVSLLSGQGAASPPRAELVVVVDLDALRRGQVEDGERCHIPGVGPLPVSLARRIGSDAFLKGVLVDGCEIKKVKHFGRRLRAELRTALELGPAPELDGVVCVEEGCGRRQGLEWDHVEPLGRRGPTEYRNLKPRCRPHHRDKTQRDQEGGLLPSVWWHSWSSPAVAWLSKRSG